MATTKGPRFSNFSELRKTLEPDQWDVLQVRDLRDATGKTRAKALVVQEISRGLESHGMVSYPTEVPRSQDEWVYVYVRGSRFDDLIRALHSPGPSVKKQLGTFLSSHEADASKRLEQAVEWAEGLLEVLRP